MALDANLVAGNDLPNREFLKSTPGGEEGGCSELWSQSSGDSNRFTVGLVICLCKWRYNSKLYPVDKVTTKPELLECT